MKQNIWACVVSRKVDSFKYTMLIVWFVFQFK